LTPVAARRDVLLKATVGSVLKVEAAGRNVLTRRPWAPC